MRIRELPPLRLDIDIRNPDGRHYHWSEQEPNSANQPANIAFNSTMPGGFAEFSCTLPRKPGFGYADQERLSQLTLYGPGGDIAWQGRLEGSPRSAGQDANVAPRAVGYQAALDDRKDASMVYVGRDLSRWGEMSRARRFVLLASGVWGTPGGPTVSPDNDAGLPALLLETDGEWISTAQPISEAYYDAGPGNTVASVYYDIAANANTGSGNWAWFFYSLTTDDPATWAFEVTGDLQGGAAGYFTPATARRYAMLEFMWNSATANTNPGVRYGIAAKNLAVYGNHGLTKRGTDPKGFYPSDIVRHVIDTWTDLTYTTGTDGTVVEDTFVIPHIAFHEQTTPAEMIRQATRFGLQDWAVWDDQTFWWHPRGTYGRNWRARVGPSRLEESGPSMERLWNSVVVEYKDVDGSTRTVGPTGSGADTEDASLTDTDPENPANKAGITRRQKLQMGVSTAAGAVQIGARFLEETKALDKSGKATHVGHIEDDHGVIHPVWRMRAGDTVTYVDADDPSPRRIVSAQYSHPSRSVAIDLDAPPEGIKALLERLGVVLVPLGL